MISKQAVVDGNSLPLHSCGFCSNAHLEVSSSIPTEDRRFDTFLCLKKCYEDLQVAIDAGCLLASIVRKLCETPSDLEGKPDDDKADHRFMDLEKITVRVDWREGFLTMFDEGDDYMNNVTHVFEFDVKTFQGNHLAELIPLSEFPQRMRRVDDDAAFETAKTWLEECHRSHHYRGSCPELEAGFAPSRLIQVGTDDGAEPVRLVATKGNAERSYAALSYCWGGGQPVKLTQSTLEQFQDRFPYDQLPRTIQDAITVTRGLDIPYLWVDSLCIVQDDPDDVAHELGIMHKIYQNAYVTISASSASSFKDGFLAPRTPAHFIEDPVYSRAWTFQEQRLSPRILEYGTRELRWVCRTTEEFAGPQEEHRWWGVENRGPERIVTDERALQLASVKKPMPVEPWQYIVQEYSARKLTYPRDRLVAISAVAADQVEQANDTSIWEKPKEETPDKYLAGLWFRDLRKQLLWRRRTPGQQLDCFRASSSSWASVDGPVYYDAEYDPDTPLVQTVEAEVVPSSAAVPYGEVTGGFLRLHCAMRSGLWHPVKNILKFPENKEVLSGHESADGEQPGGTERKIFPDFIQQSAPAAEDWVSVHCLAVSAEKNYIYLEVQGLIVVKKDEETYRRLGTFRIRDNRSPEEMKLEMTTDYLRESKWVDLKLV